MRTNNIKVKLTIPFPVDTPDANGVVYSRYAIERAINSLRKGLPIMFRGNQSALENPIPIGCTTGDTHIVTWDNDNGVCNVTIDGVVYFGGTECIVKDIEDNIVKDFEIVGFGLSL